MPRVSFNLKCAVCNRQNKPALRSLHGFTLIELLVVVAIISLLVSILLPSLSTAKSLAKSTVCMMKLRGVSSAYSLYFNDNDGDFPPLYGYDDTDPGWSGVDSWRCVLLEYMDTSIDSDTEFPAYTFYDEYYCPGVSRDHLRAGYNYGMNDLLQVSKSPSWPQITDIHNPSQMIQNGDNGGPLQLLPYIASYYQYPMHIPNFRHLEKVNLLMVDGHCDSISEENLDSDFFYNK